MCEMFYGYIIDKRVYPYTFTNTLISPAYLLLTLRNVDCGIAAS